MSVFREDLMYANTFTFLHHLPVPLLNFLYYLGLDYLVIINISAWLN